MSQAAGRPDLFGRSTEAPKSKRGFRQKVSIGLLGLMASIVVWSFVLGTAARCFQFAVEVWDGGTREFMLASIGSLSFAAAGLHYVGQWGAVLAGGQGLAVLLGLGLTISPATGMRRAGSLILVGWAGLWLAGGVSLAMEVPDPTPEDLLRVLATAVIFACTVYRSVRVWSPRKRASGKGGKKS
ncbi:MAG: hypothetical protein AAFR96_13035 [Planctomycetota bacterium]